MRREGLPFSGRTPKVRNPSDRELLLSLETSGADVGPGFARASGVNLSLVEKEAG